jgi:poly(A) polymerase/tRNA nucleotidyltransferase (CCA-adding enzyme)
MILPELTACKGVFQGDRHTYDVFQHSIAACVAAPDENLPLKLAALFHDIGKAKTSNRGISGELHFYHHESVSSQLAERILSRLKFPNRVVDRVSKLIKYHMFNYRDDWSDAAVLRFIRQVCTDNVADLVRLRIADQEGMGFGPAKIEYLVKFLDRIDGILEQDTAMSVKDLQTNGEEIMNRLGLLEGPYIGMILEFLLETVVDDPSLNDKKRLLDLAERFYRDRLET